METEPIKMQKRSKSALFWIGLVCCVYEAVVNSLVSSGVDLHPILPAIGVAFSTVLIYCNGNNPSLTIY